MNIKTELIMGAIFDTIKERLEYINIDADKIANTTAITALSEIQEILKNSDYSDFEMVDKITCVFEKYNLNIGECHDF